MGLREIQRQQDEHGDHDTVSEDGNNKIHPGARFLQVRIPHHALGEMRFYVSPRRQTALPASARAPLARELPRSSTTSPSSSLYISSPFLRRAGCQHTAQACGAKCRLACGSACGSGNLESGRREKALSAEQQVLFDRPSTLVTGRSGSRSNFLAISGRPAARAHR